MDVSKKAAEIIRKYCTKNPFEIAREMNINILYEDLGSINGYFDIICRIKSIHINNRLNEQEQHFTCAHELAHIVLHLETNTAFLLENTYFPINKNEIEANIFAMMLLITDDILNNSTLQNISAIYNVPEHIIIGIYKNKIAMSGNVN